MRKIYKLDELDCALCGEKMQKGILDLKEVKDCTVSYITQKMTIEYEDNINEDELYTKIKKICHKIEPDCQIIR